MTVSAGQLADLDTQKRSAVPITVMPAHSAIRREDRRESTVFTVPQRARLVKDLIWTAVIGVFLAGAAVVAGIVDVFADVNLTPLIMGAGLASVAFGLTGFAEKYDSVSRRSK